MAIAKKLTASAIASSLLLAIAGPAFAADQTTVNAVAQKMFDLGIIKGNATSNGTVDLNLNGTLTRAELVTTIVRSFGQEQTALLAVGAPSFSDVHATDWYSGWVAVAKTMAAQKGIAIGRDANTFDANGQLSKVEALVFVMKFMGINVPTTPGNGWYTTWVNEAVSRGIIPAEMGAELIATGTAPAARGSAFTLLDKGYSFKDANGKSLYTTFADSIAPELTLTVPENTGEAKLTLAGTVKDNKAVASVVINGQAVTLTNGAFAQGVNLNVGKNAIVVVVTDIAGNVLTKNYEVLRGNVEADRIDAADITVTAGQTAAVAAKLVDKNGEAVQGAIITGESTVGSFANGTFTAGTKAGEGTLVLKSGDITKTVTVKIATGAVAKISASSVKPGDKVTVVAQDEFGNAVTGATFTQSSADALIDATTGTFIASKTGSYTVTATKDGVSATGKIGVYGVASALKINAPATVLGNGASVSTVTVNVVDEAGNLISDSTAPVTLAGPLGAGVVVTSKGTKNGVATFEIKAPATLAGSTIDLTATSGDLTEGTASVEVEAQVATSLKLTADKFMDVKNPAGSKVTIDVLDQAGKVMVDGIYDINVDVTGAAFLNAPATTTDTLAWSANDKTVVLLPQDVVTTGAVAIKVSSEGLGTATATLNAAYAGAAAKIVTTAPESTSLTAISKGDFSTLLDTPLTYTARLTDKNGVPVTAAADLTPDLTLAFSGVADKANTWVNVGAGYKTVADYELNNYKLTFAAGVATFDVIGAKAGSFTVQVVDAAKTLTASATSTITVNPGAAEFVAFTGTAAADTVNLNILRGATTGTSLKVVATDKYGNAVKQEGLKVTFAKPDKGVTIDGSAESVVKYTNANGEVTADIAIANYVTGPVSIGLTSAEGDTIVPGTVQNVALSAHYFLPSTLTASFAQSGNGRSSIGAGEAFDILVNVKDQEGNLYDDAHLSIDNLFVVTIGGTEVAANVLRTDAGKYTLHIASDRVTKKGTADIKVAISELATPVAVTRNLGINAGAAAGYRVVESTWTDAGIPTNGLNDMTDTFGASVTKNVAKAFTVQITDAFGNAVTGTSQTGTYAIDLAYVDATSVPNTDGEYAVFTDENGVPVSTLNIAKGKTTAKFYLRTNVTGSVSLSTAAPQTVQTLSVGIEAK